MACGPWANERRTSPPEDESRARTRWTSATSRAYDQRPLCESHRRSYPLGDVASAAAAFPQRGIRRTTITTHRETHHAFAKHSNRTRSARRLPRAGRRVLWRSDGPGTRELSHLGRRATPL